jgi:hypothetical protein
VASDCHKSDNANANRDGVVQRLRDEGFRVDGLGRCMHTNTGPEGVQLARTRDTHYNLYMKREVLSKYLFHFSFENSLEPGYVTEKPFDALIGGAVICDFTVFIPLNFAATVECRYGSGLLGRLGAPENLAAPSFGGHLRLRF